MGAYKRTDKHKIEDSFERVYNLFPRLKGRCNQKALTLSGGEQQMLAVGRALMSKPTFMLMDEPSLGLAPNLVTDLYKTIASIMMKGIPSYLSNKMPNPRSNWPIMATCSRSAISSSKAQARSLRTTRVFVKRILGPKERSSPTGGY